MLISVIICTYNRPDLLKKCLASFAKQTLSQDYFEIIVIDNNSSEKTKKTISEYRKKYINLKTFYENRQGLSYARNRGWQEAKGKYIVYIDDDAIAEIDWLEQIIKFIKRNQKAKAFGGPYNRFAWKPFPTWLPENYFTLNLGDKEKTVNLKNEWISGTNMIFRRSLFEEYGGFRTDLGMQGNKILYGEETEFLLRIKQAGESVYYVPQIRVKHLVAEWKLNLWWSLKNDFWQGFSYSLLNRNKLGRLKQLCYAILSLSMFPFYLFNYKSGPYKKRLYLGLSKVFLFLGRFIGEVKLCS